MSDVEFASVCAPGQFLDGAAVKIARREIHLAKQAGGRKYAVHQADALDQFVPVNVGNQAQAGNDVAHGDRTGALSLVFVVDDRVGRRSLRGQHVIEPRQRGGDPRILVAQPVHQLDCKCSQQRRSFVRREYHRCWLGDAAARSKQAVGECIRRLPRGTVLDDLLGKASEVFDHHDPQRDCDRPEFADRQGLYLLISAQEAAQHVGIEMAVGVGDEGPGQSEHPWISRERPVDQLRQLPIIPRRQGGADLADLPLDDIVVVNQPFGGGRDGAALVDRSGDHAVGMQQNGAIVGEPARQGVASGRRRCNRLRGGKAARVRLQTLDAEQFVANGFPAVPRRRSARATKGTAKCSLQPDLDVWPLPNHSVTNSVLLIRRRGDPLPYRNVADALGLDRPLALPRSHWRGAVRSAGTTWEIPFQETTGAASAR